MCLLACGAYTCVFKTCVQTFVTASFEVIVSILCIGDQSSFVRSFVSSFSSLATAPLWLKRLKIPVNVILIDNGEAWERYVLRQQNNSSLMKN